MGNSVGHNRMSKHTIHVISYTHWDREWYMPFERHRRRLVMLLDALLEPMDKDGDFQKVVRKD